MTEEERPFLAAIKRHNWLVAGVMLCVIAAGVVISHWVVFAVLSAEIHKVRCSCSQLRMEGNSNHNQVHVERPWTNADSVREQANRIQDAHERNQLAKGAASK